MNKIKKLRLSLGMSQQSFANAIGTSKMTVSHYERGIREPLVKIAHKISDFAASKGKKLTLEGIYPR